VPNTFTMKNMDDYIHTIIDSKDGMVFSKKHNSGFTKIRLRFLANGLLETTTTNTNRLNLFTSRTTKEQLMCGFKFRKIRYLKQYLARKFREGFVEYNPIQV